MFERRRNLASAFSLVELVIVIVIIGLLAAIAIPRFGHASAGAGEAALKAHLKLLRNAIELYSIEHQDWYPAYKAASGSAGHASSEAFEMQLTMYTDEDGDAVSTPDATHVFGPYINRIPELPVGTRKGKNVVKSMNWMGGTPGASGDAFGWEFGHYTGEIRANLDPSETASDTTSYCDW